MLLTIDIGNTNIHFGIHDGSSWCCNWRARTIHNKMADEYAMLLRTFFNEAGLSFKDIDAVAMACVVPPLRGTFIEICERYIGKMPLLVGPGIKTGLKILIDNPHEVGADRVVNAVAARQFYGGPAIVVDFGTSTNYDVLNADGDYIGGSLSPGIGLAHDALVNRAARLFKVDLVPPPNAIGRNTVHALQSGLFLGYLGMIEGIVSRIKAELDHPQVKVIGTGGLAPLFSEHTDVLEEIMPNLTLEGLRIIWELNQA